MKRPINLRIPLGLACCISFGGAAGYLFVFYGFNLSWLIAIIPMTAVFFIFALIKRNKLFLVVTVMSALVFSIGAVNTYLRLENFRTRDLYTGQIYSLCGSVYDKGKDGDNEYIIIDKLHADGNDIDGKIIAYLSNTYGEYCEIGDKVSFSAKVSAYDLFAFGRLNSKAEKNIKYYCYIDGSLQTEFGSDVFEAARAAIYQTLEDNLDGQTSAVAYAMLTGITDNIEDETLDALRYGGIAHIFAVSGLHIGLVFGLLSFICKRLKINKYLSCLIVLIPLFLYVALCGYSFSSVRAFIMCAVYILAKLINRKHDSLNALSISVILILLISPLSLFSVGFQLSACAVLGICLLSKRIEKLLKRLPKRIASTIGISLSAQLGVVPVMLINFGYISGAGLLLNIIVVPILSVLFAILFVCVILAAFPPFLTFILPAAAPPLKGVISFFTNYGFERSLIRGFGSGLFIVFYSFIILLLSDKLNLKKLYRGISIILAAVTAIIYVCARTFTLGGYEVTVSANYGGGITIIKNSQGAVLVIEDGTNTDNIENVLSRHYASRLKGVVILGGESSYIAATSFDTDVYLFYANINLEGSSVHYDKYFELIGANFTFTENGNLTFDCNGVTVGIRKDSEDLNGCKLIISSTEASDCECDFTAYYSLLGHKYNVYEYGDLKFKIDGGVKLCGIYPKRAVIPDRNSNGGQ